MKDPLFGGQSVAHAHCEGSAEPEPSQDPVICFSYKGEVSIIVPVHILKFAAENHDAFWDVQSGPSVPNIKITDIERFAKDIVAELNAESEDGSTLLTRMLDHAIVKAVEGGSAGVSAERFSNPAGTRWGEWLGTRRKE